MFFRTIAILAAVFLLASPVPPNAKRDMHIERTVPASICCGFQGGL